MSESQIECVMNFVLTNNSTDGIMQCPVCGDENGAHLKCVEIAKHEEKTRDDLNCVLHFHCEFGHDFQYRFEHHKGQTIVKLYKIQND